MTLTDTSHRAPEDRPLKPALLRGWRRRCPNCGAGPMLRGYLKVRDSCPVCGEELHHHRADDGPAYLTILIVGHLLAPLLLFTLADGPNHWFWPSASRSSPWSCRCIFCRG